MLILALPVLAACTVVEMQIGATSFLKIKGTVTTPFGGHASGCELELSDIDDGKQFASLDVSGRFNMRYSSFAEYDSDRGAYRGMRFHVSCPDHPVSAARVFTDQQMAESNMTVQLGEIVVWDGDAYAHGKIVDQSGATRWGCFVGLYNPGNDRPPRTWITIGGFSEDLNLAEAGDQFTFEASCPGFARRGASKIFTIDMISPGNPEIALGNLVVGR